MKKQIKRAKVGKETVAILEIFLLVVSIIAFSYLIGGQFQTVSAQEASMPTVGDLPVMAFSQIDNAFEEISKRLPQKVESSQPLPDPGEISEEGSWWSFLPSALSKSKTILGNAATAYSIYWGVKKGLEWAGVDPDLAEAAGRSAAAGYIGYKVGGAVAAQLGWTSSLIAPGIGIAVAIIIFALTYEKTRYDMASFSCLPWDAPTGGQHCEKCNEGIIPCTEYRCKSLGQACELTNKGTTEELCVWVDRHNTNPPVIQPWDAVLTDEYRYSPDNTISPPDRGVNIVPEGDVNGCVAPFTPLRFGVTLDKPARCKLSYIRANSYGEMPNTFFGGSSTNKYNHSQQMSLQSLQSLEAENITLENDGEFSLYVRCEDVQGNSNPAVFVFNFCVDKGPDTTPPRIVSTSISNGEPISFNQSSVDLQAYVNEPSECRWSKIDQAYGSMENEMICSTSVMEFNAQMLYMCSTTLTGLKNRVDNNFYFRCIDQPHLKGTEDEHQRNANQESYPFKLVGTQPLVLDSAGPDSVTIRDSTNVIEVKLEARTSAGFKEGAATCSYKGFGTNNFYNEFEITGTHQHSQRLFLTAGIYKYDIQCVDRGGNSDSKEITFVVETDNMAPIVVRIFREANNLRIITDEDAMCVYSTDNVGCNYLFNDGVEMATQDYRTHSVAWNPERTFYMKCEDEFGNQPLPNQCSIIARPFEIN